MHKNSPTGSFSFSLNPNVHSRVPSKCVILSNVWWQEKKKKKFQWDGEMGDTVVDAELTMMGPSYYRQTHLKWKRDRSQQKEKEEKNSSSDWQILSQFTLLQSCVHIHVRICESTRCPVSISVFCIGTAATLWCALWWSQHYLANFYFSGKSSNWMDFVGEGEGHRSTNLVTTPS